MLSAESRGGGPGLVYAGRRVLLRIGDRLGVGGVSGWGGRRGAGSRFASLVLSDHPPTRCVGGDGLRFQAFASGAGPSSERVPRPVGCWRWRGGLGFGVVGCRVCALSSVGPRRQSGTCREVKRRWLWLMVDCAGRRLTSRQNPDRASPARPRREPTPWGVVRAALGPGPVPWPGRARCGRILHRRSGPLSSPLLLQRRGARPSARKSPIFFLFRQRTDTRFLSVMASSMEE